LELICNVGEILEKSDYTNNWWVFPGFRIKHLVTGLDLPVNIAFVPEHGDNPKSPLLYITELYGQVKVVTNDYSVYTYAKNLLNYEPSHQFPGNGESGLTGICVEPESGDLYLSMIYEENGEVKSKLVRTRSDDGLSMKDQKIVLDDIPSTRRAHQIQAVSIGFDNKIYVTFGDGGAWYKSQDENDFRGKVIRLNHDGTIPWDNPISENPVYAKGFRNPFGAAWRKSDQHLYIAGNGPDKDDRIARVKPYENYGWPNTMRKNTIFWWHYTQAPTALDFMQDGQFPDQYHDHLFVALFGDSYREGTGVKGKRIAKLQLNDEGTAVKSYDDFVVYKGEGPASTCGLAFGPDGLYFTDLHGEKQGGGNLYKVVPDVEKLREFKDKENRYAKIWGDAPGA
jgi:glucose/arabinose dehydrogenase